MMINEFTYLFLFFLVLGTILQIWLTRRQITLVGAHQDAVPSAFSQTVSLAEHQKAVAYTLVKTRFAQKMLIFDAMVVLLWTQGGLLEYLDQSWRGLGWSPLWTGVGVMFSMMVMSALIDMPANLYTTFRLEEEFGFNRTTPSLFLIDLLKSFLLLLVIGIPFMALVLWLMEHAGPFWWLFVWLAWLGFSLLLLWAYPAFIAPLFNEFKPLENAELTQQIEALLQRNGLTSDGVFVMDGSKRSGHGNAYFTGFGKHKRIVFFDTLLASLSTDEIVAVLAHEVGHFKRKHLPKRLLLMGSLMLAGLALLGWLIDQPWFYQGLGVTTPSTYMALLLFTLVIPIFAFFLSPWFAWASRVHEFEADEFAVQQTGSQGLTQALVKTHKDNASALIRDSWYSAFYDSHPPIPVRIAHLKT